MFRRRASPDHLLALAQPLLQNSHAPYSERRAACIIRLHDGQIFGGVTIDNAAFVTGYDALESALGAMIAQSGWAQKNELPQITDIVYMVEGGVAFMPAPQALLVLPAFASVQSRLHLASNLHGLHKTMSLVSLLRDMPTPHFDYTKFLQQAQARLEEPHKLADAALTKLVTVRRQAFCPVSHYAVGVVIESEKGHIYYGCNLEMGNNHALHAEGVAIAQMITAEGPSARIRYVVILTAGQVGVPCGGCRQTIQEFAKHDTQIIGYNLEGQYLQSWHRDLLPHSFGQAAIDSALPS